MEKVVAEESIPHENRSSEFHDEHRSGEKIMVDVDHPSREWFEESIDKNVKRSFALNSVLYRGISRFQEITVLDTKLYGKSAERDEFIYHECLIHPALLYHHNPRTVFIMGGGGGFGAREALKHKGVEKVVLCEIDKDVVDTCRKYLTTNREAFSDKRLQVVINNAKVELEKSDEKFDVIVGDLADPHPLIEGVACNHNQLYAKLFYQGVIKQRLNHHGIFVTQAGMTGVVTNDETFSSIYYTLKQVFNYVVTFTAHVPSFAYKRGWILASDHPLNLENKEEMESRIKDKITSELQYLDAAFITSHIHRLD